MKRDSEGLGRARRIRKRLNIEFGGREKVKAERQHWAGNRSSRAAYNRVGGGRGPVRCNRVKNIVVRNIRLSYANYLRQLTPSRTSNTSSQVVTDAISSWGISYLKRLNRNTLDDINSYLPTQDCGAASWNQV